MTVQRKNIVFNLRQTVFYFLPRALAEITTPLSQPIIHEEQHEARWRGEHGDTIFSFARSSPKWPDCKGIHRSQLALRGLSAFGLSHLSYGLIVSSVPKIPPTYCQLHISVLFYGSIRKKSIFCFEEEQLLYHLAALVVDGGQRPNEMDLLGVHKIYRDVMELSNRIRNYRISAIIIYS